MKKISTKLLCVVLSVTMLIMSLPMYAFAIDLSSEEDVSQDVGTSTTETTTQIIELPEKRTADTKHFKLEDGSYYVAQYQTAVHYLDENGRWQDIDNTLSASGSEISTSNAKIKFAKKTTGNGSIFTLHDGNRKLELSLDGAEKKVEGQITNYVTEHGEDATELQKMTTLDKISASVLYADILPNTDLEYIINGLNIKENIIVKAKGDAYSYSFTMSLNNLNASLNAKGEILITDSSSGDTVYTIHAPIMWDAADTFSDAVTMSLTSLGNGKYTLTVTADSEWMNSNDRVYPVTIDPPIYGATESNVTDITVSTSDPTSSADTDNHYLYVSNTQNVFWQTTALPEIPDSAYITSAHLQLYCVPYIVSTVYVAAYEVLSDWDETLTWEKTQLETNPQGKPATLYTDAMYINMTSSSSTQDELCHLTITPIVKKWYTDPSTNYGIMLTPAIEAPSGNRIRFMSNDNPENGGVPRLGITYQDMKGVESYWSYSSQSAGFAGSGSVNNATGNLVVSIPTLTTTDALMPITPTLIYNSVPRAEVYDSSVLSTSQSAYPSAFMPSGFRWNICETIVQSQYINKLGETCTMFTWTDGDSTEHCFLETSTEGEYSDIDGLHLTLTATETGYKITDSGYNVREFSPCYNSSNVCTGWYLSDLYDQSGNRLQIAVDSYYRPISIKLWPVGATTAIEQMKIAYNSAGVPAAVWNPNCGDGVAFRYSSTPQGTISSSSGGYLRQVIRAHGSASASQWLALSNGSSSATNLIADATASYTYVRVNHPSLDPYYVLNNISNNLSLYEITYHFDNSGRVIRVQEHANSEDSVEGQLIEFTYGVSSTVIQTSGSDDEFDTLDDLYTTYGFDSCGRTVSCYTTDASRTQLYGASNGQYVGEENENAKNSLKSSVQTTQQSPNYLLNGGFEAETSESVPYWSAVGTAQIFEMSPYQGFKHLSLGAGSATQESAVYQYVTLTEGEYTLSLQIDTNQASGIMVLVNIESQTDTSNFTTYRVPVNEYYAASGYVEASVNFSSDSNERFKVKVSVEGSPANSPTVFVDNIMLSKTKGPSDYDMLHNGHFESAFSDHWDVGSNETMPSIQSSGIDIFGNVLKFESNLDGDKASQVIYQASEALKNTYDGGECDPMLFTVSGWGKSAGAAFSKDNRFGIEVVVEYYDPGTSISPETFYFEFDKGITDWQFMSGSFATNPYFGLVDTITVNICYIMHPVEGYFDNISVIQDGNSSDMYSYNENGDVAMYQNGKYRSWYIYEKDAETDKDTDLVEKIVSSDKTAISYEYDDLKRVTKEIYSKYPGVYNYNKDEFYYGEPNVLHYVQYTYDAYGLVTNILTSDNTDSNLKLQYYAEYNTVSGSHIFGTISKETDSLGNITKYFYNSYNGRLYAMIYPDGNGVHYTYDAIGNLTQVLPAKASGTGYVENTLSASVGYDYSSTNDLVGITTESTKYNFVYDEFGNPLSVSVGDTEKYTLATYSYATNNGKLQTLTYGNGLKVSYIYDALDRISQIQYNTGANGAYETVYSYTYDTSGNLYSVEDHRNHRIKVYVRDHASKLIRSYEYDSETYVNLYGTMNTYDNNSRASITSVTFDYTYSNTSVYEECLMYSYSYSELTGNLSSLLFFSSGLDGIITPIYDNIGRTSSKSINFEASSESAFYNELIYDYKTNGTNESGLISQIISKVGQSSTGTLTTTTYNYTYDANGNITQIADASGVIQNKYTYDDLGQLTREDNRALNKSYVWTYDNAGNILSRTEYAFTTGTLGTATSTVNYTYSNSNWGDQLTSFDGGAITYDTIGNPVSIGGFVLTWEGRQLKSFGDDYEFTNYTYNADGIRTVKEYGEYDYNGYRHEYTLNGSQIVREVVYYDDDGSGTYVESYTLVYIYDEMGSPIGMKYRTPSMAKDVYECFFFEKNLQGDIVSVYNSAGVKVIAYTYDAWGNFIQTHTGGSASDVSVATKNPFRYRGYYYDTDTGLYYLQSRYYNPEWGRFINADLYLGTGGFGGYNLFAYCSNNPVVRCDFSGCAWDVVIDAAFIGWDVYELCDDEGYKEWENWAALGVDVVFAIVPFVSNGAGKVVKISNVADDVHDLAKVTVVGETMQRVQNVAKVVNASDNLYDGFKAYTKLSSLGKFGKVLAEIGGKASNVAWLYGKVRQGYTVIDIGIDTTRALRSSSYIAESIFLAIWKYRNIWKLPFHIWD